MLLLLTLLHALLARTSLYQAAGKPAATALLASQQTEKELLHAPVSFITVTMPAGIDLAIRPTLRTGKVGSRSVAICSTIIMSDF